MVHAIHRQIYKDCEIFNDYGQVYGRIEEFFCLPLLGQSALLPFSSTSKRRMALGCPDGIESSAEECIPLLNQAWSFRK